MKTKTQTATKIGKLRKKRNSTFSRLWFTNSVLFKSFSSERDDDGAAGGVKYKKKQPKSRTHNNSSETSNASTWKQFRTSLLGSTLLVEETKRHRVRNFRNKIKRREHMGKDRI